MLSLRYVLNLHCIFFSSPSALLSSKKLSLTLLKQLVVEKLNSFGSCKALLYLHLLR